MHTSRVLIWFSLLCLLAVFTTNCATERKKVAVGTTALLLEDIAQSAYKQTDTRVIREGMPAYLMLMDGMVEAVPDNDRLLIGAAQDMRLLRAPLLRTRIRHMQMCCTDGQRIMPCGHWNCGV